jgi:Domain of unknown function (DUF4105)
MKHSIHSALFPLFYLLLFSVVAHSGAPLPANIHETAQHKQWLDLLHYHQSGFIQRFESQVDDEKFFLSKQGKYDPKSELEATLEAFKSVSPNKRSAICRFPARYYWLKQQLPAITLPDFNCPEFDDWFNRIDAKSLTLSFPAAYLNSPSSMFGHTFIRIDRVSGDNALLDYSVNFAANANPDDNELVFTYKGLSGGYPGVFSVLPYYEKVKEYSHLESRDVWEYQLNLSQAEVEQFVRHTWEIKDSYLDYYFFDENCSYQLLTLLDAASERLNLTDNFTLSAIPADTVRIVEQSGLVDKAVFRPSTLSIMSHMLTVADDNLEQLAKNLVEKRANIPSLLSPYPEAQQAKALELAYQYARYLSVRKKADIPDLGKRTIAILSARSKIAQTQVYPAFPTPKYRDDEGHHSRRLSMKRGYDGAHHYMQAELRLAYHDQLDALPGYLQGAKLEMFNAHIRRTELNDTFSFRLHELRLIDIATYTPRNDFITPISWHVSTGFKRPLSNQNELSSYLSAGGGASYLAAGQRFYILGSGEIVLDNDIHKGHWLGVGPRLGWLSQHENWNLKLEAYKPFDILGAKFEQFQLDLGISLNLSQQWQLRASTGYSSFFSEASQNKQYQHSSSAALIHYF